MLLPRANPNAPHPFDLILCDLMLPGLTGEELIANLRNHGDTTPVIVVSARTACTDRVALLRMGADDYICKPFDLDELAARVDVQLRRRTVDRHMGSPRSSTTHARLMRSPCISSAEKSTDS